MKQNCFPSSQPSACSNSWGYYSPGKIFHFFPVELDEVSVNPSLWPAEFLLNGGSTIWSVNCSSNFCTVWKFDKEMFCYIKVIPELLKWYWTEYQPLGMLQQLELPQFSSRSNSSINDHDSSRNNTNRNYNVLMKDIQFYTIFHGSDRNNKSVNMLFKTSTFPWLLH